MSGAIGYAFRYDDLGRDLSRFKLLEQCLIDGPRSCRHSAGQSE
jgi:hypothetical protein